MNNIACELLKIAKEINDGFEIKKAGRLSPIAEAYGLTQGDVEKYEKFVPNNINPGSGGYWAWMAGYKAGITGESFAPDVMGGGLASSALAGYKAGKNSPNAVKPKEKNQLPEWRRKQLDMKHANTVETRAASFSNESIMVKLLGDGFLDKLDAKLHNSDDMTTELAQEVYDKLSDRLDLSQGEREALEYLQALVNNTAYRPDLVRNIVFKAAHALGIKLPSSMF